MESHQKQGPDELSRLDPRRRLFGHCVDQSRPGRRKSETTGRTGQFLRSLILFDHVTVHTLAFREFPAFVEDLGLDATIAILNSGAVSLFPDSADFTTNLSLSGETRPMNRYRFARMNSARYGMIDKYSAELRAYVQVSAREFDCLTEAIAAVVTPEPVGYGEESHEATRSDLEAGGQQLKLAVNAILRREYHLAISPADFDFRIHDQGDFYAVETNLAPQDGEWHNCARRMGNGKIEVKPLNRSLRAAKATKQDESGAQSGQIKMAREGAVKYLHKARNEKNDEFYTVLSDIEKELKHYKKHFKNETVLSNCDDPKVSNFFVYFSLNFEQLGLKKLITTCYKSCDANLFSEHKSEKGVYLEYDGDKNDNRVPDPDEIGIHKLKNDGDFRSEECIELLKQANVVVTNPPFSLFREYVAQLVEYGKKFLIIGNWNAITYKEIFKLIKENRIWIGINSNRKFSGFIVPEHYSLHGTEARVDENGNRIVSRTCFKTGYKALNE